MREYELTVVYDLAVQEAGGPEASIERLKATVEGRYGKIIKVDHWGRRRMAYPINRAIDGDYIVTRVEMEPASVSPLEAALRIDESVYRHLVVRADEIPEPLPPREPRQQPAAPVAAPIAEAAPEAAPAAETTADAAPAAVDSAPAPEAGDNSTSPAAAEGE